MKAKFLSVGSLILTVTLIGGCGFELQPKSTSHEEMIQILNTINKQASTPKNDFSPKARLLYVDSLLSLPRSTENQTKFFQYLKATVLMELGQEDEAIRILEALWQQSGQYLPPSIQRTLGIAYLRQGERSNCIANHAAESCIFPIQGLGIHEHEDGSTKAIGVYTSMLTQNPDDLESRWLLNLAYMTLGDYPGKVPAEFLLPGMEGDTTYKVKPFEDVAADLKLDVNNMAGGSITEDFDNDGYLDVMTSAWGDDDPMHYFKNNANGTFSDLSDKVGLRGITGGLNMMQTDYNNDGFKDVFVLRGGWKGEFGKIPNSLLKNNGDGTFTDVTTQSGLLSFHPTQTATWNDFNNDGWVDVFIGNESIIDDPGKFHPCELYINNQDGTFREIADKASCRVINFVKGVTSGDYDNDGWKDIFISTMDGERKLLRNLGLKNDEVSFRDVTREAGLANEHGRTFPTWFWDYNNDGWLDIFVCDYTFDKTLAYYAAAEKLGIKAGSPEKMLLYKNNQNGTFTNVAREAGLTTNVFAMGSNFGDIDNDGFLDMYLGTGNPPYQAIIPNKMFKNLGGEKFADVTTSARVGHLQKGHGVSFADMDNDGDQDIYTELGGAYQGDSYQSSFFLNPGQNDNNWICMSLQGTKANRAAIGSHIRITFQENGITRTVHRDVNSGGSFGSSPMRREIGLGKAARIDELEITWHGSGTVQVFHDISPNQFIRITEGVNEIEKININKLNWILPNRLCLPEEVVVTKLN